MYACVCSWVTTGTWRVVNTNVNVRVEAWSSVSTPAVNQRLRAASCKMENIAVLVCKDIHTNRQTHTWFVELYCKSSVVKHRSLTVCTHFPVRFRQWLMLSERRSSLHNLRQANTSLHGSLLLHPDQTLQRFLRFDLLYCGHPERAQGKQQEGLLHQSCGDQRKWGQRNSWEGTHRPGIYKTVIYWKGEMRRRCLPRHKDDSTNSLFAVI